MAPSPLAHPQVRLSICKTKQEVRFSSGLHSSEQQRTAVATCPTWRARSQRRSPTPLIRQYWLILVLLRPSLSPLVPPLAYSLFPLPPKPHPSLCFCLDRLC